jgi:hypothetical protein
MLDLLGRGAMKQLRLPLGCGNQFVTQPDGLAYAGKLWQFATSVKGTTRRRRWSISPPMRRTAAESHPGLRSAQQSPRRSAGFPRRPVAGIFFLNFCNTAIETVHTNIIIEAS